MTARSRLVGKIRLAPFGIISGKFVHGPEKYKKYSFIIFSLVVQWLLFNWFGDIVVKSKWRVPCSPTFPYEFCISLSL